MWEGLESLYVVGSLLLCVTCCGSEGVSAPLSLCWLINRAAISAPLQNPARCTICPELPLSAIPAQQQPVCVFERLYVYICVCCTCFLAACDARFIFNSPFCPARLLSRFSYVSVAGVWRVTDQWSLGWRGCGRTQGLATAHNTRAQTPFALTVEASRKIKNPPCRTISQNVDIDRMDASQPCIWLYRRETSLVYPHMKLIKNLNSWGISPMMVS